MKLICGPFFPALEEALAHGVAEKVRARRSLVIVTPSGLLSERLQRLLTLERGLSLLDVRFHTFFSLTQEASRLSLCPPGLLPDSLLLDTLLHHTLKEPSFARGLRPTRGLSAALRSTLLDLWEAGVSFSAARDLLSELTAESPDSLELERLAELQSWVESRLAQLKVESFPQQVARVTPLVASRGFPGVPADAAFFYYGFYDVNGVQLDLFQTVARRYETTLFFSHVDGHPGWSYSRRLYETGLAGMADTLSHLPWEPSALALGGGLPRLFGPEDQPTPEARVEVVSASGARQEVWEAAKTLWRWKDQHPDWAWGEMAVVARDVRVYQALIEEVFAAHWIPWWSPQGAPLFRFPAVRAAWALLNLRRRDCPAGAVRLILGSRFRRPLPGEPPGAAKEWLRVARERGIGSGWVQWRNKGEGSAEKPAPGAALWGPWLGRVYERLDPENRPRSWSGRVDFVKALVDQFLDWPDDDIRRAWEKSLEDLRVLDAVAPGADEEDFLDVWESHGREQRLDPKDWAGEVRILPAMAARGQPFRGLILLGLNDDQFPRTVREDPLLRDRPRALLRHPGGYWLSPKMEGVEEERLVYSLMVSSAREQLCLSFQRSDERGRPRVPSLYLTETLRGLGENLSSPRVRRCPRPPLALWRSVPPELLTPWEMQVLSAAQPFSPRVMERWKSEGLRPGLAAPPTHLLSGFGAPGPWDGLTAPGIAGEKLKRDGLSPTAVDTYRACPFRFFVSRVLGLAEPEDDSSGESLDQRVKGTLYHAALAWFFEPGPSGVSLEKLQRELLNRWGPEVGKRAGLYPLVWRFLAEDMTAALVQFVLAETAELSASGFQPVSCETDLSAPQHPLPWRGRLDRVDVNTVTGEVRVVDYKTRKLSFLKKAADLKTVQPALYLALLAQDPRWSSLRARGVFFRSIELGEEECFPAQHPSVREALVAVAQAGEDMLTGRFLIRPDESQGGACEYCSFDNICRKKHGPSRWRAFHDA